MHQWFTREEFEQIVNDALDSIPKRFADLIENVAITIEDEPSARDRGALKNARSELLGLYRGVSLMDRGRYSPMLPDEIAIFRGPISRVTRSREQAVKQVRDTVIHEIGHYFGLTDEELP
jgi:predicted Zn-dependent protease with MMP-like domain